MENPKSTASIFGHPIHPMLVSFPIAFFVAALACDLAFWSTRDAAWVTAATWLLGAGLVMAALAAVMGVIDFLGDQRIRAINDAWQHAIGNVLLVIIQLVNFYVHYALGVENILSLGVSLSVVATLLLLFNGWKGWSLVQTHHVGVSDDHEPQHANGRDRLSPQLSAAEKDDHNRPEMMH